MLLRILFWFIVFYSLFKLLIRVVLPFVIKLTINSKMKGMKDHMKQFDDTQAPSPQADSYTKQESKSASKGDYIDFEEVK